jgi:RNA polymerase sigma-70 factor (ECF subfamily)
VVTSSLTANDSGEDLPTPVFGVEHHAYAAENARIAEAYEALRPSLCAYLRRRSLELDEVDDIVQDAFVRLLLQRPRGITVSTIRFWLFRVVHNLAIDRLRSVWRYLPSLQAESDAVTTQVVSDYTPEDDCLRNEQWFLIEDNLSKLTARQRLAIGLWMQGLSYREIGRSLETSTHTVEELVRRGFNRLRDSTQFPKK